MSDQAPQPADASYDDVPLESALERAHQANADADDREELAIDYGELIDTGVAALRRETFLDLLQQPFHIDLGATEVQLKLVEVSRLAAAAPDLGADAPQTCEPFRLVFRGASQRAALPEGIYRLSHKTLGSLELYLRQAWRAPGPDEPGDLPHLEALFN